MSRFALPMKLFVIAYWKYVNIRVEFELKAPQPMKKGYQTRKGLKMAIREPIKVKKREKRAKLLNSLTGSG